MEVSVARDLMAGSFVPGGHLCAHAMSTGSEDRVWAMRAGPSLRENGVATTCSNREAECRATFKTR